MKSNKITGLMNTIKVATSKHSPEILTGLGIAGMVTSTVLAVKATPKALQLIDDALESSDEELTKLDIVKVAWKPYVPAVITCAASTVCLIGASSVNLKRNAALTAAYELSRNALVDYKNAVVETIGEKKAQEVSGKVAKKHIDEHPVIEQEIFLTEQGSTLCYDVISGRYFKSDIEKIKRAENHLNKQLMDENYISLNDFYYELGLPCTKIGNELGWNSNDGLIDLTFNSQLTEDGRPCLVVDYCIAPRYNYSDFGY